MDLQKAKKLLAKINSLYSGMENDTDGSIATIEKDLMRSYVRQFYEIFLDTPIPVAAPKKVKRKVEIIKSTPKPTPPPPPPAPKREELRIIELSDEVKEFIANTPTPAPVPRVVTPAPKPTYVPPIPTPSVSLSADEEVLELFEEKKATDIAAKLSSMPVSDLTKAMGLNERILTVNELFGGDANEFKKVMTDLNNLRSFDEAKQYLATNVVEKYGWTKRNKKSKAKILIKTIRRRYA
ncbi:MAG: hypothetical protein ACI85O_002925 [Saprospiraceae bacterium]|jgi:hypothetical protein